MLGIKEWNLDTIMFTYLWSPFKWIGKQLQFLQSGVFIAILAAAGIVLLILGCTSQDSIPSLNGALPIILMSIALMVILFAFFPEICYKSMDIPDNSPFIYHGSCIV